MLTTEALEELSKLEASATPEKWAYDDGSLITKDGETGFEPWPGQTEYENCDADTEFIAAIRNAAKGLIEELKDLRILASDHITGLMHGASTFDEIDRAKKLCLKWKIKENGEQGGHHLSCPIHEEQINTLEAKLAKEKEKLKDWLLYVQDNFCGPPKMSETFGTLAARLRRLDERITEALKEIS